MRNAKNIVLSGLLAGTTSAAVLCLLARRRDKSLWQVLNATSHWVHGEARHALIVLIFPIPASGS